MVALLAVWAASLVAQGALALLHRTRTMPVLHGLFVAEEATTLPRPLSLLPSPVPLPLLVPTIQRRLLLPPSPPCLPCPPPSTSPTTTQPPPVLLCTGRDQCQERTHPALQIHQAPQEDPLIPSGTSLGELRRVAPSLLLHPILPPQLPQLLLLHLTLLLLLLHPIPPSASPPVQPLPQPPLL